MPNALLVWCQQRLAPYDPDPPTPKNFSKAWADGRCFVCLIHSFFPSKVPLATLRAAPPVERHRAAYRLAKELAGIADLLVAEDTVVCQDSLSIQAYLSLWPQKLDSSVKVVGGLKPGSSAKHAAAPIVKAASTSTFGDSPASSIKPSYTTKTPSKPSYTTKTPSKPSYTTKTPSKPSYSTPPKPSVTPPAAAPPPSTFTAPSYSQKPPSMPNLRPSRIAVAAAPPPHPTPPIPYQKPSQQPYHQPHHLPYLQPSFEQLYPPHDYYGEPTFIPPAAPAASPPPPPPQINRGSKPSALMEPSHALPITPPPLNRGTKPVQHLVVEDWPPPPINRSSKPHYIGLDE